MTDTAATLGPAERLHPISLLSSLASSARGMWGLFAAGGYFAVNGHWFLLAVTLAVYTIVSLGSAILHWSHYSFSVGEREIRIDSGLLNRSHRSLPFDRIQDVTIEQNPLWRALNLARVRFETGGSAGAGEDDGALAAIPLHRAAAIRDLVRASRGLTQTSATTADIQATEAPVFAMDLKRVLLSGVFNFSLAVLGGLVGLTQTVGGPMGIDPFDRDFWEGLFLPGTPIGNFVALHQVAVFIAGAVVLVLVGLGAGLLRTLLRDYGFRLDRTAAGLRRRRGLLTVTDVVLPAKRTQAAILGSGPMRSRFGWSELKLQSLAKEDGGKGDHVVAPLANDEEVGTVLAAIGWPPPVSPQWRRVSRAYVLAFLSALLPAVVAAAVLLVLLPVSGVLLAGGIAIVAATRWLAWRRYAFALDADRLLVRSGWWRRRVKILPIRNIQSVDFQQTIIDRRFGAANLDIGVAGGGLAGHGIKALPSETAREIREQLLSRFA
jgi:putative membrane protein